MPMLLGLFLVALFIWLAENIGTFTAAWVYPSQKAGWHMVSLGKLGAWFLLMIISYALVVALNRPEAMTEARVTWRVVHAEGSAARCVPWSTWRG